MRVARPGRAAPRGPVWFATPAALRRWFQREGGAATELWIGLVKTGAARKGIRYPEALDEALCAGWIDGVRRSIDDERWTIRFTPRTKRSTWSKVNLARVQALIAEGRMTAAGLAAHAGRDEARANRYSFEQARAALDAAQERAFRARARAWAFWQAQPPGYRKVASWWVISAKKEETRARRLAALIAHSAKGERIPQLVSPKQR